ncbi:hypothetical protein HTZ84_09625 [Haloterrigena sp. SYSU A558-1]|uniref:DUF5786 domain-containing protein n=2 Tax=Haloterrigena TaxID=121871 RepID=A0ABX2L8H1_9EURY|nr:MULTISPECIES: hypothetical protein [Haloterrigena]NUC72565.1 hypothetical protein [Haloterrigena gelatinilytica]QRV15043.1 hypothetical protein JMJ58_19375 [Haloterrigena salifodinae]
MSGYDDDGDRESYKTYGGACDPSPDDLFITADRDRDEFSQNREDRQHGETMNDLFE